MLGGSCCLEWRMLDECLRNKMYAVPRVQQSSARAYEDLLVLNALKAKVFDRVQYLRQKSVSLHDIISRPITDKDKSKSILVIGAVEIDCWIREAQTSDLPFLSSPPKELSRSDYVFEITDGIYKYEDTILQNLEMMLRANPNLARCLILGTGPTDVTTKIFLGRVFDTILRLASRHVSSIIINDPTNTLQYLKLTIHRFRRLDTILIQNMGNPKCKQSSSSIRSNVVSSSSSNNNNNADSDVFNTVYVLVQSILEKRMNYPSIIVEEPDSEAVQRILSAYDTWLLRNKLVIFQSAGALARSRDDPTFAGDFVDLNGDSRIARGVQAFLLPKGS